MSIKANLFGIFRQCSLAILGLVSAFSVSLAQGGPWKGLLDLAPAVPFQYPIEMHRGGRCVGGKIVQENTSCPEIQRGPFVSIGGQRDQEDDSDISE